jgi:tetratricopeptide (TPR) repeat protein
MEKKEILELIEKLNGEIENTDDKLAVLYSRAELYTKLQKHNNAINDYIEILDIDSSYKDVAVKLDMLKTIVKFVNTNIYASTNTNMDPWM